jgi:hypothetical protein
VLGTINSSANTQNSGVTWHVGTPYASVRYFWGLSCTAQQICVAVGSNTKGGGIVLRSADGGLTWVPMLIPGGTRTIYAVTCLSSVTCFAAGTTGTTDTNGHGVVLRTTNGATWGSMAVAASVTVLKGITCVSTTRCTAVGGNASSDAVALTYH